MPRKTTHYQLRSINFRVKQGFTLIELLVVITIIGILVSIAVASYTSAQGRSRDARRKGDLDAIKKSLELLKADSSGGTWYPNCDSGTSCVPNSAGTNLSPDLTSVYIKAVPNDPSNSAPQVYTYFPTGCTGPGIPQQCSSYTLVTCLENTNDAAGIAPPAAPAPGSSCTAPAPGRAYLVTNP